MKKLSIIFLSLFITFSNLTNCMEVLFDENFMKVQYDEEINLIEEKADEIKTKPDSNHLKFKYEDKTFELNDDFHLKAGLAFGELGKSDHFDTKKLKTSQKQLLDEEGAQKVEIETADKITLEGYFLDRGSDKVLLIGQGFIDTCDVLIPYFKLFPDYDILIINYRWHSLKFLKNIFNDPLTKFIIDAQKDVIASVEYLRNNKKYDSVTGIGLCYSGLVYAIAEGMKFSNKEKLFDKLIIDSSYYSTQGVAESVTGDPVLCCENKHGGTPDFLQSIFSIIFTLPVNCLGSHCLGDEFEDLSMSRYLQMITIPIMFIHGKNDLLVPFNPFFKEMYNAARNGTNPCALITENPHVLNHFKSKEAYAYLGKMFIEAKNNEEFIDSVKKFAKKSQKNN